MIKTVIFDIDNTMYSYDQENALAIAKLKQYCHVTFGWQEQKVEQLFEDAKKIIELRLGGECAANHNRLIRFQLMLEMAGKPLFPFALQMYHQYWDTIIEQMKPETGLLELIQWFVGQGIQIGVGTDLTTYIQFRKLERLAVAPWISWLVTSEEVGKEKPAPEFFEVCIAKARCLPAECLFIGDNLQKDVFGPMGYGMQAALYHPQSDQADQHKDYLSEAGYTVIRSFDHYLNVIKNNEMEFPRCVLEKD